MGKEVTSIYVGVRASSEKFKSDMAKIKSSAKSSFGSMAAIAGVAIAGAAVTVSAALFKLGQSFEKATQKIAFGTGAAGEALTKLKGSFEQAFAKGIHGADEVASAIANINTLSGFSGDELSSVFKELSAASEIGGISLSDLSDKMGKLNNLFENTSSEDYIGAVNKVVAVSQQSGVGMDKLVRVMSDYGATFKAMGLDFEASADLIGLASKAGVNVTRLMPALGQAARKAATDFQELGSVEEAMSKWLTLIANTTSESEKLAIAVQMFGSEGGLAINALVEAGVTSLSQLGQSFDSTGTSASQFVEQNRTSADRLKIAWNSVKASLAPLGEILVNTLNQAMPTIETLITQFSEWLPGAIETARVVLPPLLEAFKGLQAVGRELWDVFSPVFRQIYDSIVELIPVMRQVWSAWSPVISSIADALGGLIRMLGGLLSSAVQVIGALGFGLGKTLSGTGSAGLPGFASGGSFTIGNGSAGPASGPVDSQLVAFMASPGERVTVETPGQQRMSDEDSMSASVAPVFNISTGVQETVRAEILSLMPRIRGDITDYLQKSVRQSTRVRSNLRYNI